MSESAMFALVALLHVPGVVLLVALLVHARRSDPGDSPPGGGGGPPWRWRRGPRRPTGERRAPRRTPARIR